MGFATQAGIENMANAWRRWKDIDGGFFSITHIEITCRKK
jgi:hypothetical protein